MKLEEMAIALGKASMFYSNFIFPKEKIVAWWELFQNEDAAQFVTALHVLTKEPGRAFFPTPGEVSGTLTIMQRGEEKTAEYYFEKLREYARLGKDHKWINLQLEKHPAAKQALARIGGFLALSRCDIEKEMPFKRNNFIQYFNEYKKTFDERSLIEIGTKEARNILEQVMPNTRKENKKLEQ